MPARNTATRENIMQITGENHLKNRRLQRFCGNPVSALFALVFLAGPVAAQSVTADELDQVPDRTTAAAAAKTDVIPDLRLDDLKFKASKGNFLVVPIPLSNPTLGTGLILGAGYFYAQTAEQKAAQPASVTGAGGMYTSDDSWALALGQASYWAEDKWRFKGGIGYANLQLTLPTPGNIGEEADWDLEGGFLNAQIARKIGGHWYGGIFGQFVDINQSFSLTTASDTFALPSEIRSSGLGVNLTFDSRDLPSNAYTGRYFLLSGLFNSKSLGSDTDFQAYSMSYRAYHLLKPKFVLAWEVAGCDRQGSAPLWDACRIDLRGFSVTDYMGKSSAYGQAEARLKLSEHWGIVAFAGAGQITSSFTGTDNNDWIPSYGIGLRFMVMQSQRINMRLDYGRSTDSDAVYLAVGEAF
jgi:hypothetical protein